jgi:hypothetical protein
MPAASQTRQLAAIGHLPSRLAIVHPREPLAGSHHRQPELRHERTERRIMHRFGQDWSDVAWPPWR